MAGKPKSRGYVKEWMQLANRKQADLVKLLGYSKAKANAIWHGEQRLNEDIMEEIAPLVSARPYELMMTPDRAMHFRKLEAALASVQEEPPPAPAAPEAPGHAIPLRRRKAS